MEATAAPSVIANLKLLNHDNYEDWSFRMQIYLLAEDLWDFVNDTNQPPRRDAEFKVWSKLNAKALHLKPAEASKTTDEESELHTNHTLISGDAGVEEDSTIEVRVEGPEGDANDLYTPFFQTLLDNDWDAAMEYVRQHPEKLNAIFEQFDNGTALHFVVSYGRFEIAKELVQLMSEKDLEILDSIGRTALNLAVLHRGDSHEIVKCMVEKNKKLLSIRFNNDEIAIPFVLATIEGRVAMSQYLYSASPLETLEDRAYAGVVMSACVVKSRFGRYK
ncbi:uncharacterized protein Pyn_32595 [Prunus yedoensis var. nudiflora]|uniref:DUF4219 domain-containing protein n=1 Tax=Prunus yedoensis var. nudiflora TaxID=2094558 RepID=A0A314XVQ3_PRUYE|nr:uncharacterized protein Pyn_32595 [Prunus yedoensis var. nudiflora]